MAGKAPSNHDCTHVIQSSSSGLTLSVLQGDSDRDGRQAVPLALSTRVKFRESARGVRLETRQQTFYVQIICVVVFILFLYFPQIQVEKGLPTAEEAYNFFTFSFEQNPQDKSEKTSRRRQKQKRTAEEDREEGEVVKEQEDAEVDEDNQDENEDQVRH